MAGGALIGLINAFMDEHSSCGERGGEPSLSIDCLTTLLLVNNMILTSLDRSLFIHITLLPRTILQGKKHGGAGKGKWLPGKHSDHLTLLDDELPLDENDPLYVAEEDADPSSYVLSSHETADELRISGAGP
eukprot:scaffold13002_cov77-Skeletonema_dohrnii-CCMP3373.AAC.1